MLEEELTKAKAPDDPELLSAAQSLIALIKKLPQGEKRIQQITQGTGIAQATNGMAVRLLSP